MCAVTSPIVAISSESLDLMLENHAKNINTARGRFLCEEAEGWTAVDNTTGDTWVEHFKNKESALKWLHPTECEDTP